MAGVMPSTIDWQVGFEIELLAPPGLSRKDLAIAIGDAFDAAVHPCFHPQAELSEVPGAPIFENLTLGYDVLDGDGALIARCADDLTLQADLDRSAPPKPGWYRIAGDDARLLRLIMAHADPSDPLDRVLHPIADLFGTEPTIFPDGMVRLADSFNASIAIAAPLPGERERPCEIITPPIDYDHWHRLDALLAPARDLGFTVPLEAASHIHFDGERLCSAAAITNLVRLLTVYGDGLKRLLRTNSMCRRLGSWPQELSTLVDDPGFQNLSWEDACEALKCLDLTKYCDFNLFNLVHQPPGKHTFEFRILPVSLEADPLIQAAALFEAILRWTTEDEDNVRNVPSSIADFISELPMDEGARQMWLSGCEKFALTQP